MDFNSVYKNLNDNQKKAVDTIEGPLLYSQVQAQVKHNCLVLEWAIFLRKQIVKLRTFYA